jgi:hypothetical protein
MYDHLNPTVAGRQRALEWLEYLVELKCDLDAER